VVQDLFVAKLGAEVAVSNKELGMEILVGGVNYRRGMKRGG
jgi:hypothetical protein